MKYTSLCLYLHSLQPTLENRYLHSLIFIVICEAIITGGVTRKSGLKIMTRRKLSPKMCQPVVNPVKNS